MTSDLSIHFILISLKAVENVIEMVFIDIDSILHFVLTSMAIFFLLSLEVAISHIYFVLSLSYFQSREAALLFY